MDAIVKQFMELTAVPGVSKKEKPIIDSLKAILKHLKLDFEEDGAHRHFGGEVGNLICKVSGNCSSAPPLLLAAHVDTVEETCGNPEVRDGKIVSTCDRILGADDRVGVTVLVEILKQVSRKDISFPPLEVVFVVAEEIGLQGSRFLDYRLLSARRGINFDASARVGQVVVQAPTTLELFLRFSGREAHAAVNPEKGINAITLAARAINRFDIPQHQDETTFNLGKICGGSHTNIIPRLVEVTGEARAFDDSKLQDRVGRILRIGRDTAEEFGGKFELDTRVRYRSFSLAPGSKIVQLVRAAYADAGVEFVPVRYLAGSDANNFNHHGIEAVNIGLGYKENHTPREFIRVADLVKDVELGIRMVEKAAQLE